MLSLGSNYSEVNKVFRWGSPRSQTWMVSDGSWREHGHSICCLSGMNKSQRLTSRQEVRGLWGLSQEPLLGELIQPMDLWDAGPGWAWPWILKMGMLTHLHSLFLLKDLVPVPCLYKGLYICESTPKYRTLYYTPFCATVGSHYRVHLQSMEL